MTVRRGDVVVDIGAHVGMFVVRALQLGAARVIAYEPAEKNVRLMRANVSQNATSDHASVTIVEAAVAGSEGTATLGLGQMSVGNVLADIVEADNTHDHRRVRTTTLECILRDHGLERIDYLKVDCEGSEGAILESTTDEVLRRIGCLALEYHDDWSSMDHDAIATRLRDAGFEVAIVPEGIRPFGMIYASRETIAKQRESGD